MSVQKQMNVALNYWSKSFCLRLFCCSTKNDVSFPRVHLVSPRRLSMHSISFCAARSTKKKDPGSPRSRRRDDDPQMMSEFAPDPALAMLDPATRGLPDLAVSGGMEAVCTTQIRCGGESTLRNSTVMGVTACEACATGAMRCCHDEQRDYYSTLTRTL